MANFFNRARMSTATTGTGTITLSSARTAYASFQEAGIANGDRVAYTIEDGNNFEVGRGIYSSSGNTLTRVQILLSKINGEAAGTSPLSLSGNATVFLTATAEDLRSLGPYFAVEAYGAKGDGSTNDSAAIQAAVDAAEASLFVKRVYLPTPSVAYVFNATITLPTGVSVFGDNRIGLEFSRCKPAVGFTGAFFQSDDYGVSRVLRIGIEGLFLDGSSTTFTAIEANCQESVFRDLTIKNCFTYGIHISGVGSGASEQALNNNIYDCYLAGQVGIVEFYDALFLDNHTADTRVRGCYFEAAKDSLIRSRGYNDIITGNHLFASSASGGGAGYGYYSETSSDKTLIGNYIENTANAGMFINGGGSDVATLNATIQGNNFRNIDKGNTSNGVIVIQGSDISSVAVSGNVVRRDAATSYATPYFVYFNGITPSLYRVYGNIWQSGLITTAESNLISSFSAPLTNDGASLGTAAQAWSDLFLASGAVVNYANGNLTETHSSGLLTTAGRRTITYTGADGSDTLTVDTSASSITFSPAFKIILPATGPRKAFQAVNSADSFAWASFEYEVGGTAKPGLALGPGSGARDVNLYRDAADVLKTDDEFKVGKDLTVTAGTTAIAPIRFQSGTNLTTPAAGVLEYDGSVFYATPIASNRALTVIEHFLSLSADQTGTNVNTAQPWFPGGGATGITLAASTSYFFDGFIYLTKTAGTNARTIGIGFGGTATITSIGYDASARTEDAAAATLGTISFLPIATAANTTITASSSSASQAVSIRVKGIVRINGAGTFIPQFTYSAAPGGAPTVKANSFFRLRPMGSSTVLSVGNWS